MSVSLIKPQYQVAGLTNYSNVPIPGTTVRAFFGVYASQPSMWYYSLWTEDDETPVSNGFLEIPTRDVTPEQVARIAFILDVEYAEHGTETR